MMLSDFDGKTQISIDINRYIHSDVVVRLEESPYPGCHSLNNFGAGIIIFMVQDTIIVTWNSGRMTSQDVDLNELFAFRSFFVFEVTAF